MPKKQKRDSVYYAERLKNEFPAVYADLQAAKHRTVTEAAIAAGLKKARTRSHELKNAWQKATPAEQVDFLRFLTAAGVALPSAATAGAAPFTVAVNFALTPTAISRIKHIMLVRRMRMGEVMTELGLRPLDASVGMAMKRNTHLQPHVINALETWLLKYAAI